MSRLRHAGVSVATMSFFSVMFFGVIPAIILLSARAPIRVRDTPAGFLGGLLAAASLAVVVWLTVQFIREGEGTPAPLAPPGRLVRRGLYTRLRNPMYLAYVGVVLGEALLIRSWLIAAYAGVLLAIAHAYVVGIEEPTLRSRFGADYEAYCRRVPRWWPRLRAPEPRALP